MRKLVLIALLAAAAPVEAQVYRWVEPSGTVHYSQSAPPTGVQATVVDIPLREGPPSPDSKECYTVRCQEDRLDQRIARREMLEERLAAERAASAPKRPRGLDFRNYVSLERGMTEGELLSLAGDPDLLVDQGAAISAPATVQIGRRGRGAARAVLALKTYTYLPTPGDPFITTITLVGGRISDIERERKF